MICMNRICLCTERNLSSISHYYPSEGTHWHSLARRRGLPKARRTDNGKEFCGKAMLAWAHARGIRLFLIESGKPNQNAYIESFNRRLRDECLNENGFVSLPHAKAVIEA